MKNFIKYGLIFVGGTAVGGAVAWFITKKHYDKFVNDEIDRRVAEESEANKKWLEEREKMVDDVESENDICDRDDESDDGAIVETIVNVDINSLVDKVNNYTDEMNRRKEALLRSERIRYDTISKQVKDISAIKKIDLEEGENKDVDEVLLRENDDNPRSDIYVINSDQFAHEHQYGWDKITLYWWELERILSEEDMSILDVPDILGYGWESKIGSEEKDIVYVRNENMEADYEVIVQHESYYDMRD